MGKSPIKIPPAHHSLFSGTQLAQGPCTFNWRRSDFTGQESPVCSHTLFNYSTRLSLFLMSFMSVFKYLPFATMRTSILLLSCGAFGLSSSLKLPLPSLMLPTNTTLADLWQPNGTSVPNVSNKTSESWPDLPWTLSSL